MSQITPVEQCGFLDYGPTSHGIVEFIHCTAEYRASDQSITFTDSQNNKSDHFTGGCTIDAYRQTIKSLVRALPGVGTVYGSERQISGDAYTPQVTVATIAGVQRIKDELAPLQPVMDVRSAPYDWLVPITDYLTYIDKDSFPVSYDPDTFMHDMADHAVGALTIRREPLAIVKLLIADAMALHADGHPASEGYMGMIGEGIDAYTETANYLNYDNADSRKRSLLNHIHLYIKMEQTFDAHMAAAKISERALTIMQEAGGRDVLPDDEASFRAHMAVFSRHLQNPVAAVA